MSSSVAVEIPVAESVLSRYEVAAQVFDRAVQAGCQDPNVLYMLAMAHKRQGKTAEARNALRKIQKPDANVLLQMGLLSLQENKLAQAEGDLLHAWLVDKTSYEICYNLLLTQPDARQGRGVPGAVAPGDRPGCPAPTGAAGGTPVPDGAASAVAGLPEGGRRPA